jgi:hypothetical protein
LDIGRGLQACREFETQVADRENTKSAKLLPTVFHALSVFDDLLFWVMSAKRMHSTLRSSALSVFS